MPIVGFVLWGVAVFVGLVVCFRQRKFHKPVVQVVIVFAILLNLGSFLFMMTIAPSTQMVDVEKGRERLEELNRLQQRNSELPESETDR